MAHILLGHDHPTIRHAVTEYLERLGHTVATAPRARFALESARFRSPLGQLPERA